VLSILPFLTKSASDFLNNFIFLQSIIFSLKPFSPITIPYLFKRAKKLGIDIIPGWYKKLDLNDKENKLE